MSPHIHYVIACLIFEVLFVITHRKSSNAKQLLGMIFLPVLLYLFTYRYPFLTMLGQGQVYAASLVCFLTTIILCTFSFEPPKNKRGSFFFISFFAAISVILIFLVHGIPWLIKTFPLENPDAIIFTLLQNKTGTEGFVWGLIWNNILCPTIAFFVPISIAICILSVVVFRTRKTWCLKIFHYKICLHAGLNVFFTIQQLYFILFLCSALVFCVTMPKLFLPLSDLCKVYFESNKKSDSELYLKEYVFPDSTAIAVPKNKKNLIYIMMESMMVNFNEFTPEIDEITKENLSFEPGGVDVAMTGWTIAAQVSKICGIPLNVPSRLENNDSIVNFLPNIKCLTDILAGNGYNQAYIQGSNGEFASTKKFWTQHKVNVFHDFSYYVEIGKLDKKKEILWGVTDKRLYNLIRDELDALSKDTLKPFALYAATIDTHFPEGHMSEGCEVSKTEKSLYPSVLRCASKQLDSFLKWAQMQDWYEKTVIIVVGDHTWTTFVDLLNMPKDAPLYWINLFVNTHRFVTNRNRKFSSFEMFPTVLEALNFEIDGHRLGLGTSLFSTEKTLLEKMAKSTLDSLLKEKSYQYDYFMFGGSFKRD